MAEASYSHDGRVDRKRDPDGNHLLGGFPRLGTRESHNRLIGRRGSDRNWEVVEEGRRVGKGEQEKTRTCLHFRTWRVHFRPLEYAQVRQKYRAGPFQLFVTCKLRSPTASVNFFLGLL
jgi:hypothetical protein